MVEIEYRGRIFKSWKSYAKALEREVRRLQQFLSTQVTKVKCPKCGVNGTKILRMTSCGKCSNCKDGPSHVPYYYVAHRVGKKVKWCYIGKNWPSGEITERAKNETF